MQTNTKAIVLFICQLIFSVTVQHCASICCYFCWNCSKNKMGTTKNFSQEAVVKYERWTTKNSICVTGFFIRLSIYNLSPVQVSVCWVGNKIPIWIHDADTNMGQLLKWPRHIVLDSHSMALLYIESSCNYCSWQIKLENDGLGAKRPSIRLFKRSWAPL